MPSEKKDDEIYQVDYLEDVDESLKPVSENGAEASGSKMILSIVRLNNSGSDQNSDDYYLTGCTEDESVSGNSGILADSCVSINSTTTQADSSVPANSIATHADVAEVDHPSAPANSITTHADVAEVGHPTATANSPEESSSAVTFDFEIILNQRGKQQLLSKGFIYNLDKKIDNVFYWECVKRKGSKCGGRLVTIFLSGDHRLRKCPSEHNHLPDALRVRTAVYKVALKRRAIETTETPEKITRTVAAEHPLEVQTVVSKQAQKKLCQRYRRQPDIPADPEDYAELNPDYSRTTDGRPMILCNKMTKSGRFIIFGTIEHLRRLEASDIFIMDGTFKKTPKGFKQVYTIHGSVGSGNERAFMPFVHMLLPNKKEVTYRKAFNALMRVAKRHNIILNPSIVLTDFEQAAINAFKLVFPNASPHGCFFHWCQNLFKRIQKYKLAGLYASDLDVQKAYRQTTALAFLPPQEVPNGFAAVRAQAPVSMKRFFDYVQTTYVLGKTEEQNGEIVVVTEPRYKPVFWASESHTMDDIPRTSNSVEGYHNKFNKLLPDTGPQKFYKVVECLIQEERSTSADYLRLLQGDVLKKRNKKTIIKEKALKKAIRKKATISFMDHIVALSLVLQNK